MNQEPDIVSTTRRRRRASLAELIDEAAEKRSDVTFNSSI